MQLKRIGIALIIICLNISFVFILTNKKSTNSEIVQHPGWMDFYLDLKSGGTGILPNGLLASWYKADKQNDLRFKKAENSLISIILVVFLQFESGSG